MSTGAPSPTASSASLRAPDATGSPTGSTSTPTSSVVRSRTSATPGSAASTASEVPLVLVERGEDQHPRRQPVLAPARGRRQALVRRAADAVGHPLGEDVAVGWRPP